MSIIRSHIVHVTRYEYARPVTFGRHRLVLRPREGHDVEVEQLTLRMTPRHRVRWTRDVFDNAVALVDFLEPADRLVIESRVVVDRHDPAGWTADADSWLVEFPVAYDPLEASVAAPYQALTYPDDVGVVSAWMKQHFEPLTTSAEQVVEQLAQLVFDRVAYQRRFEKGVQTPAQTIERGSGSCRDMAVLMMEAARSLGLAARFVSGYLDGASARAGRASMHAWVEVYLPMLGWQGYDPTLGARISSPHLAVGVSNHPRGVMPVSGVFTGRPGDFAGMTASVHIQSEPRRSVGMQFTTHVASRSGRADRVDG